MQELEDRRKVLASNVLRRVAAPYLAADAATLTEDRDGLLLTPANPRAAEIRLAADQWGVTVTIEPPGNNRVAVYHEVADARDALADDSPEVWWVEHLEQCLLAVVEGRYTEKPSWLGRKMIFNTPGRDTIVYHSGRWSAQRYEAYTDGDLTDTC